VRYKGKIFPFPFPDVFKIEKFSEKAFNLVSNTAVNNLPKQLKIVIGRNFFGSK
jgi:hypothetical protein